MAQLIDGKVISAQIKDEVKEKVAGQGEWALIANDGILRTGGGWQVITDGGKYTGAIK